MTEKRVTKLLIAMLHCSMTSGPRMHRDSPSSGLQGPALHGDPTVSNPLDMRCVREAALEEVSNKRASLLVTSACVGLV